MAFIALRSGEWEEYKHFQNWSESHQEIMIRSTDYLGTSSRQQGGKEALRSHTCVRTVAVLPMEDNVCLVGLRREISIQIGGVRSVEKNTTGSN